MCEMMRAKSKEQKGARTTWLESTSSYWLANKTQPLFTDYNRCPFLHWL